MLVQIYDDCIEVWVDEHLVYACSIQEVIVRDKEELIARII